MLFHDHRDEKTCDFKGITKEKNICNRESSLHFLQLPGYIFLFSDICFYLFLTSIVNSHLSIVCQRSVHVRWCSVQLSLVYQPSRFLRSHTHTQLKDYRYVGILFCDNLMLNLEFMIIQWKKMMILHLYLFPSICPRMVIPYSHVTPLK